MAQAPPQPQAEQIFRQSVFLQSVSEAPSSTSSKPRAISGIPTCPWMLLTEAEGRGWGASVQATVLLGCLGWTTGSRAPFQKQAVLRAMDVALFNILTEGNIITA